MTTRAERNARAAAEFLHNLPRKQCDNRDVHAKHPWKPAPVPGQRGNGWREFECLGRKVPARKAAK